MQNQSFFKLPLLFTFTVIFIKIVIFIINTFNTYGDYDIDSMQFFYMILNNFNYTLTHFITLFFVATIINYNLGISVINLKNVVLILIAAVFLCLFLYLFYYALNLVDFWMFLYEFFETTFDVMFFDIIIRIVYMFFDCLLFPLFTIIILKITSCFIPKLIYQCDTHNTRKIYAVLFSLFMLIIASIYLNVAVDFYELFFIYDEMWIVTIFVIISILIAFLVQYVLVYVATINCFYSVKNTIEFGKLFKSIGLSLLFILVGSLVLFVILFILGFLMMPSHYYGYGYGYGYGYDQLILATLVIGLVGIVGGITIYFFSIRKAIKIIFADKRPNITQAELN